MATAIRMKRGGRTHEPYYRIVVIDSRNRNRGLEIDTLGVYHPCARPEPVSEVDVAKALEWLRKGAQPSDTARSVLRKLGVMKHFHDDTMPETEELVAKVTGGVVEDKGYNAPIPKKDEVVESVVEDTAPVEAEAPDTTESEATEETKTEE